MVYNVVYTIDVFFVDLPYYGVYDRSITVISIFLSGDIYGCEIIFPIGIVERKSSKEGLEPISNCVFTYVSAGKCDGSSSGANSLPRTDSAA